MAKAVMQLSNGNHHQMIKGQRVWYQVFWTVCKKLLKHLSAILIDNNIFDVIKFAGTKDAVHKQVLISKSIVMYALCYNRRTELRTTCSMLSTRKHTYWRTISPVSRSNRTSQTLDNIHTNKIITVVRYLSAILRVCFFPLQNMFWTIRLHYFFGIRRQWVEIIGTVA